MIELLSGRPTRSDWIATGVILLVAVGLGAGFFFGVHKNKVQALADLKTKNAQVATELAAAQTIAANYEELKAEVAQTQILVDAFEKRLPTQRQLATLITDFERLANQSELQVQLTARAPIREPLKHTIPYKVTADGTFHQIASFINRLERYERYLRVSDLKIEEEKAGKSTATFTLSTYIFIEPVAAPAAAATAGAAS
jgi:type IV pilus assembly protein PilO